MQRRYVAGMQRREKTFDRESGMFLGHGHRVGRASGRRGAQTEGAQRDYKRIRREIRLPRSRDKSGQMLKNARGRENPNEHERDFREENFNDLSRLFQPICQEVPYGQKEVCENEDVKCENGILVKSRHHKARESPN
jgi:hypothetical protein